MISCYFFSMFGQSDKPILKGNIILGGSLNGYYSKELINGQSNFSYNLGLTPSLAYFVTKGLAIGISPLCTYSKDNNTKDLSLGFSTSVGYYFDNGFFLTIAPQYFNNKTYNHYSNINIDENYQYNTFGISADLGYAYFIKSNVALIPAISYYIQKRFQLDSYTVYHDTEKSLSFSFGLIFFL